VNREEGEFVGEDVRVVDRGQGVVGEVERE